MEAFHKRLGMTSIRYTKIEPKMKKAFKKASGIDLKFIPRFLLFRYLSDLVESEIQKGIPSNRIVIAGYSQGGAMALSMLRSETSFAGVIGIKPQKMLFVFSQDFRIELLSSSIERYANCERSESKDADFDVSWNMGRDHSIHLRREIF